MIRKDSSKFSFQGLTPLLVSYLAKFLALLPTVSILTGCIYFTHPPYPDKWGKPPSIAEDTCTDISGTFRGIGESYLEKNPNALAYVFFKDSERKNLSSGNFFSSESYVTIQQSVDILKVSMWIENKMLLQKEFRKGEDNGYLCTNEGIVIKGESGCRSEGLIIMCGSNDFTLHKVKDCGLIVKSNKAVAGMFVLAPVYLGIDEWHRYLLSTEPTEAVSGEIPVNMKSTAISAPAQITFPARNGFVRMNHNLHQEKLKKCTQCHTNNDGGKIILGKDLAHQMCKGCHRELKAGPTNCGGCHKKG